LSKPLGWWKSLLLAGLKTNTMPITTIITRVCGPPLISRPEAFLSL